MNSKSKVQFIKTILAIFFGLIGSGVLQFGVALYILRLTGSSLSFAMTMVISPLVMIAFTPVLGHVVDRYPRKQIVTWAQLISILTLLVFSLLFQRVGNIMLLVIPILVVLRIADSFFSSAYVAAVRGIVFDNQITRLQTFMTSFQSIAGIITPLLGAALYALIPMSYYILIVAGFELIAWLINLSIDFRFNPVSQAEAPAPESSVWQSFRQGFEYIKTRPDLIRMSLVAMLVNFLLMASAVGIPHVLVNFFKLSDTQYGLVQMASASGVLIASLSYGLINREPKQPLQLLYSVGLAMGIGLVLMSLPGFLDFDPKTALYYFMLTMSLGGMIASLVNIPLMSYMQKAVPEQYKGRVFTLFSTLATGLTPISILSFGFLFDRWPGSPIFLGTGVFLSLSVLLIWLRTPQSIPHLEETYEVSSQSK